MTEEQIYHELKKIVEPIHTHEDQMLSIAKWIGSEFRLKERVKEVNFSEIFDFIKNELGAEYNIRGSRGSVLLTVTKADFKIQVPISSFSNLVSFKRCLTEELKNWATSKGEIFNIELFKNYKLH